MGKKSWFSAVKKAVSSSYLKKKKEKRSHKSKSNPIKSCHGNQMSFDACLSPTKASLTNPPHHYPLVEEVELKQHENEQQIEQAYSITYATPMEEEAADTASHADAEVNCVTSSPSFLGKSMEEIAAIKIQTAYRGYLAKRDVRTLRARRRLKLLIQGQAVKRQTASTLMSMQTMARVQSQVRARRIRMAEVNEALQRQLLQRQENAKSCENEWDLSPRSKEQVEASLRRKKEAAERREKALAYSYSYQQTWRKSLKSANSKSMDQNYNYPDWEWSWLGRCDAVRPWEAGATSNTEMGKWVSRQSPSTPPSQARLVSAVHNKRSIEPTKTTSRISNPGPSSFGSGKKGLGVGSAKKRLLSPNSPPSGSKRSAQVHFGQNLTPIKCTV